MKTTATAKQKANAIRLDLLTELHAVTDKAGKERDLAMDDIERAHILNQINNQSWALTGSYAATDE